VLKSALFVCFVIACAYGAVSYFGENNTTATTIQPIENITEIINENGTKTVTFCDNNTTFIVKPSDLNDTGYIVED
jgi:hypothetical protein